MVLHSGSTAAGAHHILLDAVAAVRLPSRSSHRADSVKWPTQMTKTTFSNAALVLATILLLGCGERAPESSMPPVADLLPERIGAWIRGDVTDTYDRETIFDYIDGAGEVYRSYAFSQVAVARYGQGGGPDMTVELFDMGNPHDAYGVFSYAREQEQPGIGGGYELKGRVLCFWQDRYYICAASEASAADTDTALLELARGISESLPSGSEQPDLVHMLPSEGLVPLSSRFFHLHQSLNYHYYLAQDNILNLGPETDAVMARYQPGSTYLLILQYESDGDANRALSSFRQRYLPDAPGAEFAITENGRFVASRQSGRQVIVVLDAMTEAAATTLLQNTVERLTNPESEDRNDGEG